MNGSGENRYSANWEKLSRVLRKSYTCAICGESVFEKLECHHIDEKKSNGSHSNAIVLCKGHHRDYHAGRIVLPDPLPIYNTSGESVTVAYSITNAEGWFDSTASLKIVKNLKPELANQFRRRYVKGFIRPGRCNYYVGALYGKTLFGVLGFANADRVNYDLFLKADTTNSSLERSTDLLLFLLRTKEMKQTLEDKFCREIKTVYSMCFSPHDQINRYRKHADLVKKEKSGIGYNLGYKFELGTIPTIKAAKAEFIQRSWQKRNTEK